MGKKLRIPFDFAAGENIEAGVYSALIEKLTYRPEVSKEESRDGKAKSPQISVQYTVTEPGDAEGETLFQNLYLTQKARRRAVAFFDAFDEEFDELVVDEETGVILEPNLEGMAVEVKVFIDGQYGPKIDEPPVVLTKGKGKAAPKSKSEDDDDADDEDEAPARKSSGRRSGRRLD